MENEQNQPPQEQQPPQQSAAAAGSPNSNPNPGRRGRRRRRRRGGRGPSDQQGQQNQQANGAPQPQGEGADASAPQQAGAPAPQQGGGQQRQGGQQNYGGGGKKRRHKHGRGGGGGGEQNRGPRQANNDNRGNLIGRSRGGGGGGARRRGRGGAPAFVGPMDHSYRQPDDMDFQPNFNGNFNGRRGGNPLGLPSDHIQAVPIKIENIISAEGAPRVVVFIDDLFFHAKIREVAKKVGVNVEFAKAEKETLERLISEEPPALVIFDLNNANAKPLTTIPKLKAKFKKETSIVGFVQHIQGDLKLKAQEAGCDMVVPRSAFSANLPNLLRRHSEGEEEVGYERGPAY